MWLRSFIAVVFFILLMGSLQWSTEIVAQRSGPAKQDVILLLDNSRSMGAPRESFDEPDRRRIRIARLLAHYLMIVEPETTSLGVAVFGPQTTPRVSLKPLTQWQERDISAIRPLSCHENGTEMDPCYGTRYSRALSWAQDQLQDCLEIHQQHPDERRCRIIMVSDSDLERNKKGDSDSPEEIYQAFQNASASGVETLILFLDDYPQTEWQRWRDEGLFEYEHKLKRWPLDAWLDRILQFLELRPSRKEMTILKLNNSPYKIEVKELPRFLQWLQVDVAPEYPLTVTFPDAPLPYQYGYRYRWTRPAFSSLSMQFDGQGLVYYRVISEPAPLQVYPVQIPSEPTEDESIQLRVWVNVFGDALTEKEGVRVIAHGDVMTEALALTSMRDGSWRGALPPLPAGSHTLTLSVEVEESGSWQVRARKPISIHVHPLEMLPILEISPTVAFTGTPITFKAWLLDEQKRRLVGGNVPITVHVASPYLKKQGFSLSLSPEADMPGVWGTTTSIAPRLNEDPSPAYPLTLTATLFISGAHVATSDATSLRIWDYPSLDLSHERLPDGSVLVTVTVQGLVYPLIPTLYVNGKPVSESSLQTQPKSKRLPYVYTWLLKDLTVSPIQDAYLWAKIRLPVDSLGNPTIESPKEYLEPEQGSVPWPKFGLTLLAVIVLMIIALGMIGWYISLGGPKERKEERQKQIDSDLAKIDNENPESLLHFLSVYSGGDEYARLKLAEEVASELSELKKKNKTSEPENNNEKPDEWMIDETYWNKHLLNAARNGNELALESLVVGWHKYFLEQETTTVVEILYRKEFYPVWSRYPETAYRPFAGEDTEDEWTSILKGVYCIWSQIKRKSAKKEEVFDKLDECVKNIKNEEVRTFYDNLLIAGKEIWRIPNDETEVSQSFGDQKEQDSATPFRKDPLVFDEVTKSIKTIKQKIAKCQEESKLSAISPCIESVETAVEIMTYPFEKDFFMFIIAKLKTGKA